MKSLATFTQSGTTDDGYPSVRFLTQYGPINVTVNGPDHMTVGCDPDAYLTVSGVEIRGHSVVLRQPHNEEQAEWTRINYNARYWRRRHDKAGGDDRASSSAIRKLDELTLAVVAATLQVRPDITHKARLAELRAQRVRINAEIRAHHSEIADLEEQRAVIDLQIQEAGDAPPALANVYRFTDQGSTEVIEITTTGNYDQARAMLDAERAERFPATDLSDWHYHDETA